MAAESTWDGVSPRVLRTHGAQDEGEGRERERATEMFSGRTVARSMFVGRREQQSIEE